jgi:hypothetical protein
MPDATAAWLQKLQQQPWYQRVSAVFAAQQIAPPLWEATLLNENAGLNPSVAVYDPGPNGEPGYAYGLFQERQPGLGSGHSIVELTDPVSNAAIAAAAMRGKLNALGIAPTADLPVQLRAIELAGWNGGLAQDATRQAQLASVVAAGGTTSSGGDWSSHWNPFDPRYWQAGNGPKPSVDAAVQQANAAAGGFTSSIQTTIQDDALQLTVGAVFLALIAGGFAIMAGGSSSSSSTHIVPVPV